MPTKVSIPDTRDFRLELLDKRQGFPLDDETSGVACSYIFGCTNFYSLK
jgi:hypothetical protein